MRANACLAGSGAGRSHTPPNAPDAQDLSGMELLLPLAFIAVLYLVLIRPQQKRQKQQQQMVRELAVGADIITIGGLHGHVVALTDDTMDLEVTDDVVLRFQRSSLAKVVGDEPVAEADADADADVDADDEA